MGTRLFSTTLTFMPMTSPVPPPSSAFVTLSSINQPLTFALLFLFFLSIGLGKKSCRPGLTITKRLCPSLVIMPIWTIVVLFTFVALGTMPDPEPAHCLCWRTHGNGPVLLDCAPRYDVLSCWQGRHRRQMACACDLRDFEGRHRRAVFAGSTELRGHGRDYPEFGLFCVYLHRLRRTDDYFSGSNHCLDQRRND